MVFRIEREGLLIKATTASGKVVYSCNQRELEKQISMGISAKEFVEAGYNPAPGLSAERLAKMVVKALDKKETGSKPGSTYKGRSPLYEIRGDALFKGNDIIITKSQLQTALKNGGKAAKILEGKGVADAYPIINKLLIPAGFLEETQVKKYKVTKVAQSVNKVKVEAIEGKVFIGPTLVDMARLKADIVAGKKLKDIAAPIAVKAGTDTKKVSYQILNLFGVRGKKSGFKTLRAQLKNGASMSDMVLPDQAADIDEQNDNHSEAAAVRIAKATVGRPELKVKDAFDYIEGIDLKSNDQVVGLIEFMAKHAFTMDRVARVKGVAPQELERVLTAVKKANGLEAVDGKIHRFAVSKDIMRLVSASSVLDLAAGPLSFYKLHHPNIRVVSNDPNPEFSHDTNLPVEVAAAKAVASGESYDVVDLDGSDGKLSYYSVATAIRAAKKAVCISTNIRQSVSSANAELLKAQFGITINDSAEVCLSKFKNEVKRLGRSMGKELTQQDQIFVEGITRIVFSIS